MTSTSASPSPVHPPWSRGGMPADMAADPNKLGRVFPVLAARLPPWIIVGDSQCTELPGHLRRNMPGEPQTQRLPLIYRRCDPHQPGSTSPRCGALHLAASMPAAVARRRGAGFRHRPRLLSRAGVSGRPASVRDPRRQQDTGQAIEESSA